MKTTIAITAVLAAALAACADKPPPREPSTANTTTTTSTQYPTYQQSYPRESASSAYGQETPGATATMGSATAAESTPVTGSGTVKSSTLTPPAEPALNEPEANARPAQPAPVTANAPDGKSPNAAAAADQGNSKSEVQSAASIRKRMIASKTLSLGAKNVKVITQGTKCTLRGNVKSDAERSEIEGIARNTDGITEVDNQLVVKP